MRQYGRWNGRESRRSLSRSSRGQSICACFLLVLVVLVSGCASRPWRRGVTDFNPPVVFDAKPTLPDIIEQVNRSMSLQRLESNTLTISSPDMPMKLRGNVRWERTHNFSLEAYPGTRWMGMALVAGSNSDMFWMQTQVPSPPTLYFARHDEFENQLGPRRILPVSPLWLREALGVIELDPTLTHEGPVQRADGKIEVRSYIPSPRGFYRRTIVLDAKTSTIEQTLLYDHTPKLVAVSQMSDHKYHSAIDFSLPRKIDIQLIPDEGPVLAFTVEVGFYLVNEEASVDPAAFQPPDARGLSTVNLVQANARSAPIASTPPAYTQTPPRRRQGSLAGFRSVK